MNAKVSVAVISMSVAQEVRAFVRDRFTPGSLSSLDELQDLVRRKVAEVVESTHGQFSCRECGRHVDVGSVRCGVCIADASVG